ncbi:MAG: hypothetical protein ACRD4K_07050, partial [Candidatus Acidiferrales bacterium]
ITKDTNTYYSLTLSADAKTLATVQSKLFVTLYTFPAAGMGASLPTPTLPQQQRRNFDFVWNGNGNFFLLNDHHIVKAASDGSTSAPIVNNNSISGISSCPDGSVLLLTMIGQGGGSGTNIWRLNSDGTNLKQLSTGQNDAAPLCSTDSKWVYFVNGITNRIERVPLEGGTSETVPGSVIPHTLIGSATTDLSPDGKSLAIFFELSEGNPIPKLAVIPVDPGPNPQVRMLDPNPKISDGPRFTPDGKNLVYPIVQGGVGNLWVQPLDGSPGRQITDFKSGWIPKLQFSPDGKSLAVSNLREESDVILLRDTGSSQ